MAAPTATTNNANNRYVIDVTGTNVDAGNNDYTLQSGQVNLDRGFSVITGTVTNMTITVLAANKDGTTKDITSTLFGVSTLATTDAYICDIPVNVKSITIRAARSNATNEINMTIRAYR